MDRENNSKTVITQTPVGMEGNPAGMAHVAGYFIIYCIFTPAQWWKLYFNPRGGRGRVEGDLGSHIHNIARTSAF